MLQIFVDSSHWKNWSCECNHWINSLILGRYCCSVISADPGYTHAGSRIAETVTWACCLCWAPRRCSVKFWLKKSWPGWDNCMLCLCFARKMISVDGWVCGRWLLLFVTWEGAWPGSCEPVWNGQEACWTSCCCEIWVAFSWVSCHALCCSWYLLNYWIE